MYNKKYLGMIGYSITVEKDPVNHPSVWTDDICEKQATGDILMNNIKNETTNQVNDNITLSNQISIMASPYALQNMEHIVYATYMNVKWKVTNVKVALPRLILTLGGSYNEQED